MATKQKLLITGVSGFLGYNLVKLAKKQWECHGTINIHDVQVPDCTVHACNVTDTVASQELFHRVKPDAVIFCAAASQPNYCEENPDVSRRINVDAVGEWARLCFVNGVAFAFTSTDLVFDGKNPPYDESSITAPVNIYGRQKREAEILIADTHPGASICRMPLMYGDPSPAGNSFISAIFNKLNQGVVQSLFMDEYRTVASARAAASGLLLCLDKQVKGIIHLGGRERVSRYECGCRIAAFCGFSQSLITPGRQADVLMPAPRPVDVSLDSSRAYAMGYNPMVLEKEFEELILMKR